MSYIRSLNPRGNASESLGTGIDNAWWKESYIHTGSFKQVISDTGSIKTGQFTGSAIISSGKVSCSQFLLTTPVYNEVFVPCTSMKGAITADYPDLAQYKSNAGSTGSYLYMFDKDNVESLFFTLQIPHDYRESTKVTPYVHWANNGTDVAGTVIWGLEFNWQNVGDIFIDTTFTYATGSAGAQDKHNSDAFKEIVFSTADIRSCFICRVFRDVANGLDVLTNDAGLIGIGFHYQANTIGSTTTTTK